MKRVIGMDDRTEPTTATSGALHADAVLSVEGIAAELGCSKAHVYNAINGKLAGVRPLPVIHMGRRALVRRSSLERWKQQNESGQE
jgi:hypothetical protein